MILQVPNDLSASAPLLLPHKEPQTNTLYSIYEENQGSLGDTSDFPQPAYYRKKGASLLPILRFCVLPLELSIKQNITLEEWNLNRPHSPQHEGVFVNYTRNASLLNVGPLKYS